MPQPVRASDADRERVAGILRGAAGAGLLSLDEVGDRLGAAYAAGTTAELAPLTADLPDGGRRFAPVDLAVRSRARAVIVRPRGCCSPCPVRKRARPKPPSFITPWITSAASSPNVSGTS